MEEIPEESVTVTLTMKIPSRTYMCGTPFPVRGVPSPRSQLKEYGGVPPETVALKVTTCPTWGLAGDQAKEIAGDPAENVALTGRVTEDENEKIASKISDAAKGAERTIEFANDTLVLRY